MYICILLLCSCSSFNENKYFLYTYLLLIKILIYTSRQSYLNYINSREFYTNNFINEKKQLL